tara:strand:+ start:23 stop:526 length:504 start_codon:yes stop_codon:yes gene_type:complete
MKWFDIIKNVNEQQLLQTLRGSNEGQKPPRPDMNAPSVPSAPDLEMEQIKENLKVARQMNNPRNIKIHTNKLNALMDKKENASTPQIPKPRPLPPMVGAKPKLTLNEKKLKNWRNVIQREKGPTGESAVRAAPVINPNARKPLTGPPKKEGDILAGRKIRPPNWKMN